MKRTMMAISLVMLMNTAAWSEDMPMNQHMMMHSDMVMMQQSQDQRISLGLNPMQKQMQLANMRSHLKAVQDIIGLIAEKKFDQASKIAHRKLGLTPEMKKMCNMFSNEDFKARGLAFHQSADALGDVLKTGNTKKSLNALHRTMNNCVACHATFRQ